MWPTQGPVVREMIFLLRWYVQELDSSQACGQIQSALSKICKTVYKLVVQLFIKQQAFRFQTGDPIVLTLQKDYSASLRF